MCFQVIACYMPPESYDPADFQALSKKYGIENTDCSEVKTFETCYEGLDLPLGYVFMEDDGTTEAYEPIVEVIYTTTNENLIQKMLKDDNVIEENDVLTHVVTLYTSEIKRHFPNAQFNGTYAKLDDDSAIMFQFVILPYRLDLCAPEALGVLKPISILGDHPIYPAPDGTGDFDALFP